MAWLQEGQAEELTMDQETKSLLLNLGAQASDVMSRLAYKRDQATTEKGNYRYICRKVEKVLGDLQKAVDKANSTV